MPASRRPPRVAGSRRAAGPGRTGPLPGPPDAGPPDAGAPDVAELVVTAADAAALVAQVPDVAPLVAELPDGSAPPPAPAGPGLLVVGRLGKPQGIRGEVTVQVRTDDPDARFAAGAVLLTDPPQRGPLTVASTRDQNGRLVVLFEGVADRNGAEALRDTLVLVDATTLPPPDDPDVFHDFQLVGLAAHLPGGARLGVVREVLHLPHGDVLAVARDDVPGAREVLVPFVLAMVPVVDVPAGRLVVDPPDGLLDLADPGPPAAPPDR